MFNIFKKQRNKTLTIFFDVDGVLNKKSDWNTPFTLNKSCLSIFKELNILLLKQYDLQYILCSTWRAGKSDNINSPQYDNLLKELSKIGIKLYDGTPISNKTRQDEIEYYIKKHYITDYIIIDDDKSLYPNSDKINLYIPDYHTGLKKDDIKKIFKMIRSKK